MAANDVYGSAKRVQLIDDTGSIVVQEVVDQLNKNSYQVSASVSVEGAAAVADSTVNVIVAARPYDVWVRDVFVANQSTAALSGATTDILLKTVAYNALQNNAIPAGDVVVELNDMSTDGLGAGTGAWASGDLGDYSTTATINTPIKVPADKVLVLVFANGEGAGNTRAVSCIVDLAMTDYVDLQPDGVQRSPFRKGRDFKRSARKSTDK